MLLKERAHLVSHITLPSFMQKLEGSTVFSISKSFLVPSVWVLLPYETQTAQFPLQVKVQYLGSFFFPLFSLMRYQRLI